jgi:hypothetical protein
MDVVCIKAIGDWELEVLAIPYGSAKQRDSQGEFFTPETNLFLDVIKSPLIFYYHSYTPEGQPQGKPELIGKAQSFEKRSDGVWVRVLLDKASAYAKRVWDAAKKGIARASSGSAAHLVRKNKDGSLLSWPFFELSLFDAEGERQPSNQYAVALPVMKANFENAGLEMPELTAEETATEVEVKGEKQGTKTVGNTEADLSHKEKKIMEEKDVVSIVADALKADREAQAAEAKKQADIEAAKVEAVKAAKAEWEAEAAKAGRLPSAPVVTKFADVRKFDDVTAADVSLMIATLKSAKCSVSPEAYKALVMKLNQEKSASAEAGLKAMKAAGLPEKMEDAIKAATDPMYTGGSNIGSDWVGVAYSNQIWEAVRATAEIAPKIPSVIIPDGYASEYFPLESTDPTFYKVAEVTAADSTMKIPAATVPASQMGTANKVITVGKLGARGMYSGELVEDSLIPFLPQLRGQIEAKGAEVLDHVIIDGDNATDASTNINDIAGTPAGTEPFMLWDGMRYIALATSGQNRSAGGGLTTDDYLNTVKLLGAAGKAALKKKGVSFIIDPNVYWASLKLDEVKTGDVSSAPTVVEGQLTRMWGYEIIPTYSMHYMSSACKANSAGKVDQDTVANNAYGAILAVRWASWKLAYKRKMTMEVTRRPESDSYEIVALMRVGCGYRDTTTAAAISYYVGV